MLIGGRFEILRELGRGGSGKTYLAEDTFRRGSPKCVVKKIKPSSTLPSVLQKARALFETEVEALYQLSSHEQIPKLLAHFEQGGEFYLVQELIDGHDLRQSFTLGDRWDEKTLLAFMREVLEILEFVHQQGVVHRDVCPQNLIRRWKDKTIELIDFGGIKTLRVLTVNAQGEAVFTQPIGTPGYMPPEQASGELYPASDIYAVGMMAIQALTGYLPNQLPRNAETKVLEWHDQAQASPELMTILDRMVDYDLQNRYASVSAILADLPNPNPETASTLSSFEILLREAKSLSYGMVIPTKYDLARNFSEGMAAVVLDQQLGYINKRGRLVIPPQLNYDPFAILREDAYQFSEGLAKIAIAHRWGFIDLSGEVAIKPRFDGVESFCDGLARVEINHHYGYVDINGQFVIRPQFESAAPRFQEGLAGVEIEHRYGYINKRGEVVIPPQFDTAGGFSEGLARVTLYDKYGFINLQGKVVISPQFDVAHSFCQGLARVRIDGRYGYINSNGEVVIPPQFEDTFSFTDNLALVRNQNKYGYINMKGEELIPLKFDDAYPFSEGFAAVKLGHYWGFINFKGEFVIKPQFDEACSFHEGLAAVKQDGKWGYMGEEY